jgi:hypothetical protein
MDNEFVSNKLLIPNFNQCRQTVLAKSTSMSPSIATYVSTAFFPKNIAHVLYEHTYAAHTQSTVLRGKNNRCQGIVRKMMKNIQQHYLQPTSNKNPPQKKCITSIQPSCKWTQPKLQVLPAHSFD